MEKLKSHLNTLLSGKISDTSKIEDLLSRCWGQLEVDHGAMAGYKLLGRMENVKWNPPLLSFTIERHGAMKFGSSRAELQRWSVNINEAVAGYSQGYRQKYKRESPLKTKPLAEEVGKLIIGRKDSEKLKWYDDKTRVRVIAGKIIPDDVAKQTLFARRKRFRRDLTEFLNNYGWQEIRPNNYRFAKCP